MDKPSSSVMDPTLDIATHLHKMKTIEKAYRIDDGGRVLKRSLRPDEYARHLDGEPFVLVGVIDRLKNEAACTPFIRKHTDIQASKLLGEYEEKGSYLIWMEFVQGVEMSMLTEEQLAKVYPQVERIIDTMQGLRSRRLGGPTGLLCPPSVIFAHHYSEWEPQYSDEGYVFNHGDITRDNVLVDPVTLKIVALLDFEYSGFFPLEHEIHFYKSSKSSGEQSRSLYKLGGMDKIIEFWRQSQTSNKL